MSPIQKIRISFRTWSWLMMVVVVLVQGGVVGVARQDEAGAKVEPAFRDYKGVRIGMSADESRQKLGEPQEKSEQQDFYAFSENEMAQIFYNDKKVFAISIMFTGEKSSAPPATAVLGSAVDPKADGSVYKMIRYPKLGYWISYSRTAGDASLVTVTLQKLDSPRN